MTAAAVELPSRTPPPAPAKLILAAHIQAVVADSYGIPRSDMRSHDRHRVCAWPRQTAMYLSRELTRHSLPHLGSIFGGRDHSTVFYAIRAVEKRMAEDPIFAADVEALREALSA